MKPGERYQIWKTDFGRDAKPKSEGIATLIRLAPCFGKVCRNPGGEWWIVQLDRDKVGKLCKRYVQPKDIALGKPQKQEKNHV